MQSFSLVPANYGIELLSEVEELKSKVKLLEAYIVQLELSCNLQQIEDARKNSNFSK